jgi:hypothetical protein
MVHAWGNKCYWCRTPKTFRHLEIDHIAPRSPRGDLDPAFDVDAAENLAPICGPCNKEKSNGEFQDAPRVDATRKAAVEAAPKVRRNLERFYKDDAVVKALLAVTVADLASPDAAEAITAFGMAIMPVFRESFPEILAAPYTRDYTVRRPTMNIQGREVEIPEDRSIAELDAQGQRAVVILEDVMGISMVDAIDNVRRAIGDDIEEQIQVAPQRDGWAVRECLPRRAPELEPDRDLRVRPAVRRRRRDPLRGVRRDLHGGDRRVRPRSRMLDHLPESRLRLHRRLLRDVHR